MCYDDNFEKHEYDEQISAFVNYVHQLESLENDDDYEVNPVQMARFGKVVGLFMRIAKENNGKIDPIKLIPHRMSAGATLRVDFLELNQQEFIEFFNVMQHCSAIDFVPTFKGDQITISIGVNNVFVKKSK